MNEPIVVDPVTRTDGHLRVEALLGEAEDSGSPVERAYVCVSAVNGLEIPLRRLRTDTAWMSGKELGAVSPLHPVAFTQALENALGVEVRPTIHRLRNVAIAIEFLRQHIADFYLQQLWDWADVVSALSADPRATWSLTSCITDRYISNAEDVVNEAVGAAYFSKVQKKVKTFVETGRLGIFANGYWGHPAYKFPPEVNLVLVAHFLEALNGLRIPREIEESLVELYDNLGLQGLIANPPSWMERLAALPNGLGRLAEFVDNVYLPDVRMMMGFHKDWAQRGEGLGNFLCVGGFPYARGEDDPTPLFSPGVILARDLGTVHPVDLMDLTGVGEQIAHSWYAYPKDSDAALHPLQGRTRLSYSGPEPPFEHLDTNSGYSWAKAPRWRGHAVEVGPLARMLLMYAEGNERAVALVDDALGKLGLPFDALYSTLGRTLCRALEAKLLADQARYWCQTIPETDIGDAALELASLQNLPSSDVLLQRHAQGAGGVEDPRGSLVHWIDADRGRIANYQIIGPSTWNLSPRDSDGQPGACEAALEAYHELYDAEQPIELLRTIHSFAPSSSDASH